MALCAFQPLVLSLLLVISILNGSCFSSVQANGFWSKGRYFTDADVARFSPISSSTPRMSGCQSTSGTSPVTRPYAATPSDHRRVHEPTCRCSGLHPTLPRTIRRIISTVTLPGSSAILAIRGPPRTLASTVRIFLTLPLSGDGEDVGDSAAVGVWDTVWGIVS